MHIRWSLVSTENTSYILSYECVKILNILKVTNSKLWKGEEVFIKA